MKINYRPIFAVVALGLLAALLFGAAGCSERIKGTQAANNKPIVQFTNIPPDGARTSRNPIVYWSGYDTDGQVKAFAYMVVLESDMGGATPEEYLAVVQGMDSSRFIWLTVTVNNPQTKQVVAMQADINDPVGTYRTQYVYLKARDNEGAESNIIFKGFRRNTNIPDTRIRFFGGTVAAPYIDRPPCEGAITGIDIAWRGEDPIDYPKDPPPFEFQWKLFGPYGTDTVGQRLGFDSIRTMFIQDVFVTVAGKVYDSIPNNNLPDTLILCDTTLGTITCDTTAIRDIPALTSLGRWLQYFNIDNPAFLNSPLNRLVDSSTSADLTGWTFQNFKSFCNVFAAVPSNVTRQEKFFFWARCRDDAKVPDPVPAFESFDVLEPKFERSVLLVDLSPEGAGYRFNGPKHPDDGFRNEGKVYWDRVIKAWDPSVLPTFDTAVDYRYFHTTLDLGQQFRLQDLTKYRVVILYGDDVYRSKFWGLNQTSPADAVAALYTAIDAGVNVWSMMKAPSSVEHLSGDVCDAPLTIPPDNSYQRYFGLETITYHTWLVLASITDLPGLCDLGWCNPCVNRRMEDFVGAEVPQGFGNWPNLNVDTANLHSRYFWPDSFAFNPVYYTKNLGWRPDIAAIPEVNWVSRRYGTEIMYLYKQKRPGENIMGPFWNLEGRPVGYRYRTNVYRIAYFTFTPLGLEDVAAQEVIDTVMNFLYEPWREGSSAAMRDDPNALVRYTPAEVRAAYDERRKLIDQATEADQKRLNPGYRTTWKE